jgi:hypothetical protein
VSDEENASIFFRDLLEVLSDPGHARQIRALLGIERRGEREDAEQHLRG